MFVRWAHRIAKTWDSPGRRARRRRLSYEPLESRRTLTAEGSTHSIDTVVDTSGLLGVLTAEARWQDGTVSALSVSQSSATGPLRARIDYSYDMRGFFAGADRRALMQAVADSVVSRFADTLEAIAPAGTNSWNAIIRHPATGNTETIINPTVGANELVFYVGSRDLPSNQIGEGGPGGASSRGNSAWLQTVRTRGQLGASAAPATDFGPWGGYVVFDDQISWHFGLDTAGLDSTKHDFVSVALHELTHALGFGTAASWNRFVSGGVFVGPQSTAQHDAGGNPPIESDFAHWREGLQDGGQEVMMDPSLAAGIRKLPTRLDLAALEDIGWQVINPVARVVGSNIYGDNGEYGVSIEVRGSQLGTRTSSLIASITNVVPTLVDQPDRRIQVGQSLNLVDLGSFTDPGFDLPRANPPRVERFTYTLDWGDGSAVEIGNALVDRVGSPGIPTTGSFDGSHVYRSIGRYTVRYTVQDDDGGLASKDFVVDVAAPPDLVIALDRARIRENAGPGAANLTVRRVNADTSIPWTVFLSNSDPTELTLPASVTLPAGNTEIVVPIDAVDDNLLDGTVTVSISALAAGLNSNVVQLLVDDSEQLALSLSVTRVAENAGPAASLLTVSRSNTDRQGPLQIQLASDDASEATVPIAVVIPAGEGSASVPVAAIDDELLDGIQNVLLFASAAGYQSASVAIAIEDFEPIQFQISVRQLSEPSMVPARGTILLPQPAGPSGVSVQLIPSVAQQLQLPSSLEVPPGTHSVAFDIAPRNDYVVEGTMNLQIRAESPGFVPGLVDLAILDDDLPIWQNPVRPLDINNDNQVTALDALLIINRINLRGAGELIPGNDPLAPPFLDANGNGVLEVLDSLLVINFLNRV